MHCQTVGMARAINVWSGHETEAQTVKENIYARVISH